MAKCIHKWKALGTEKYEYQIGTGVYQTGVRAIIFCEKCGEIKGQNL